MCRVATAIVLCLVSWSQAASQSFDPAWMRNGQPYVRIGVVEDGVYRVSAEQLAGAGINASGISPAQLQVFEKGTEIPVWVQTAQAGAFQGSDYVEFVGLRNRGNDELWAYNFNEAWQSSDHFSLYSDTTYYWLTWGYEAGLRYENVAPDAFSGGAQPVSSTRETVHLEQDNFYYHGDGDEVGNPLYTRGEGFYMSRFNHAGGSQSPVAINYTLAVPDAVRNTSEARLRARVSGETVTRHQLTLEAETTEGGSTAFRQFGIVDWTGYAFRTIEGTLVQNTLPAGNNLRVRVTSLNSFGANPNRTLLDYVALDYDRAPNLQNHRLIFHLDGTARQQVSLGSASGSVVVYNPADGRRFVIPSSGGTAVFADQPSGTRTRYFAVAPGGHRQAASVQQRNLPDWNATSHAADYLIITTPSLLSSAQALAQHHTAKNGYEVAIAFVQDIFDMFDYGSPTPIAMKRFVHHSQEWQKKPRYLMLWGDATYPSRTLPRSDWEVPSFGNASSDGWFGMHRNGPSDWTEVVAIGRITARSNEEGMLFVNKLAHYEAQPLGEWQKRALIMAGGNTISEQTALQNHSNRWGGIVSSDPFGGDTLRFFKQATTAMDPTFQDSLRAAIREGAGWLNYFGHSAAFTWEIVTDPPVEFNNADRLPVAISLGCLTGAFASNRQSASQQRVLAEQLVTGSMNGAIAHWGGSSNSYIGPSSRLADPMFQLVFRDTVRTLGKIFQGAKKSYLSNNPLSMSTIFHTLQYNLIGDPATRITLPSNPDFHVADESISITPLSPIPADSNLVVSVDVRNFGLVPSDSVTVKLSHTDPRSIRTDHERRIPRIARRHRLDFVVPINDRMVGDNRFQVAVDPENHFEEETTLNNSAARTHVVFASGLTAAFPADFGIVNSTTPLIRTLLSSPGDSGKHVLFELDTLDSFNSPARRSQPVLATALTADWKIAQPLEDGKTYYWRARIDDGGDVANWRGGSFTVRTDLAKTGFLQQGGQFQAAESDAYVGWDGDSWRFNTYEWDVVAASARVGATQSGLIVNGVSYERLGLGFGLLVLDGQTGHIRGVGSAPLYNNNFVNPAEARRIFNELIGMVRHGDYLFVKTRNFANNDGPVIPEDIKDVFRAFNSQAIDTLTYDDLWVMQARKGYPDETIEEVDPPNSGNTELLLRVKVPFNHPSGQVRSTAIGPAASWGELDLAFEADHPQAGVKVDVLAAATDELLATTASSGTLSLASVDAGTHPSLRLRATIYDSTQATTPQLKRWAVTYDPIPKLVLQPASLVLSADSLQEGQLLDVETRVSNIGLTPSGQVVTEFTVTDARNHTRTFHTDTLAAMGPDSSAAVSASLDTRGLVGRNVLRARVYEAGREPGSGQTSVLVREFTVKSDAEPPVLRVLIDGIEYPSDPNPVTNISDPSLPFVTMEPTIEVTLLDQNPFVPLQDTSLVEVTLSGRRVYFAGHQLHFEPATGDKNEARVIFRPDLARRDTTHTLRVTAQDASGNRAVNSPFQVHFRVQNEVVVDNIYPYPNPMSSFTNFAFLLKGSDVSTVEDFRIRIYTVNGRLIREFDLIRDPFLVDTGGLRIGWNKVKWDARDEDGDPVATGVYLYRAFIRVDGESVSLSSANNVERIAVIR